MTDYTGRAFLLKTGAWSGGTEVAECQENTLRINHEAVDITHKGSAGYRTLLEGAGTKSVTLSGGGVMSNVAGFETFQGYANAGSINALAMGWADGDTLEGSFMVTSFEVTGAHNGAQTFSFTAESSGSWTFTAA
jgi:TP901-1 family phage major tail protein